MPFPLPFAGNPFCASKSSAANQDEVELIPGVDVMDLQVVFEEKLVKSVYIRGKTADT